MGSGMRLYDLPALYEEIAAALEESGGELTPEIEERLMAVQAAQDEKFTACAVLAQRYDMWAKAAREESRRLQERAQTWENTSRRIRDYMLNTLDALEQPSIKTPLFLIRVQKNGQPSIRIEVPAEALPEAFRRTELKPDIAAIRAAWEAGEDLPEGVEVSVGRHLRIS